MHSLGDQSAGAVVGNPQLSARGGGARGTAEVACPRSMVGRVIGKNGETIKALQTYTGALIQIDQSTDPTRVTISGTSHSLSLAISMVTDICKGTFKGFALLRQLIQPQRPAPGPSTFGAQVMQPRPVYAPGYGLIPPSQLYGAEDPNLAAGGMALLGSRAVTVQLPPGYQYVQQQGDTQIMVGLPGTMPTHTLTQQMDGTMLNSMPMQQLPMQQMQQMQQVYSSMPGGAFTTQVAYYPQEYTTAGGPSAYAVNAGEQLVYHPQPDGTLLSLQPAQLGNNYALQGSSTGKMLATTGTHMGGGQALRQARPAMQPAGPARWSSGSGWVESKVDGSSAIAAQQPLTMGQVAVSDLLGGPSNASQAMGGAPGLATLGGPSGQAAGGSGQQQLVQVIGPEGKISYYLQGSDH